MLHITPLVVHGKVNHQVADCATGVDSTSGGAFNGSPIDRMALPDSFTHCQPWLIGTLPGTTNTAGQRYRSVLAKLRHGDSSGGGDAADFMTPPSATPYYTTAGESTDQKNWTTGTIRYQNSSQAYPLLGAKRWITVAGVVTGPGLTTSTAAGSLVTTAIGCNFLKGDQERASTLAIVPGGATYLYTTSSATY